MMVNNKTLLLLVVVVVVALSGSVAAFYEGKSPVVTLTAANFDSSVYGSEHTWIVEFYAPWCGHCQRLTPEYEKAAENLKGLVKVGAVDCDDEKNKPVCGRFEVKGFPTLKVFPGSATVNPKKPGTFVKENKDYQGARTARAIVDGGLAEIPNFSVKVSEKSAGKTKSIADFLSTKPDLAKVLLFTTKSTTTPLFKALSVDFNDRLVLGEVRDTEKAITATYEITKFPTLIVIPKDSTEHVVYEGALQQEGLAAFLSKFAAPPKAGSSGQQNQQQQQQQQEAPKEIFNPEILKLETQEQFKQECLDKPTGMCLLSFMIVEPEFEESVQQHEENLKVLKVVKKAAHDKSQAFRVFWVDALKEKALMDKFMLSDQVPSLLLLSPNKKVYRPFTAGFEAAEINSFLDESSKGKGRHFKFDFAPTLSS